MLLEKEVVLGKSVRIVDTNTGIDPWLMVIKATSIFTKDFKHIDSPVKIYRIGRELLSGEIESTSEEIGLRTTVCAIH